MKPPFTAQLACGCQVVVQDDGPGTPATVHIGRKAESCTMAIHVAGLPLYGHHVPTRPPTRITEPPQPDYDGS